MHGAIALFPNKLLGCAQGYRYMVHLYASVLVRHICSIVKSDLKIHKYSYEVYKLKCTGWSVFESCEKSGNINHKS